MVVTLRVFADRGNLQAQALANASVWRDNHPGDLYRVLQDQICCCCTDTHGSQQPCALVNSALISLANIISVYFTPIAPGVHTEQAC